MPPAKEPTVAAERVRAPQYLGARVVRVEDPTYLTGRAAYVPDITLPGMLHAAFLRSPHAHARIVSIDTSRAKELEGVTSVYTGVDFEDVLPEMVSRSARKDVVPASRKALPTHKVRFVGEAVAMVVATSRYVAEDACELVDVEYDILPAVVDSTHAMSDDAPLIDEDLESNNIVYAVQEGGDVDAAFEQADLVYTKRFRYGRAHAAPLEGRGVIADYAASAATATIWNSTQIPYLMRTWLADLLQIGEGRLRLIAPAVGGGFGLKVHLFVEDVLVPAASRMLGRPVKWIEDRYEALAASSHSREITVTVEIAMQEDGTFLAFRNHCLGNAGAYSIYPFTPLIDVMCAGSCLPGVYDIEHAKFTLDAPLTNKCPSGAYRAVGMPPVQCAREALIDEIARDLDMDPVALRLKNTIPDVEPYTNALGHNYDGGSYREALTKASELADYEGFRTRQRELRTEGRYVGIGFSPFVEPAAFGAAGARGQGYEGLAYFDSARVSIEPDGSVTITTGLHSHGQGLETTLAQVAADALGARLEDISVVFGDTSHAVYAVGTFASRSAVIGTGMVQFAAAEVREKLLRFAAHLLETGADDIELYDGVASVKGAPGRSVSVAEIAQHAFFAYTDRPDDMEEYALTATRSYDPPESFPNGVIVAVVEVDVKTGFVDIERIVAVEDCGVMLNPLIVDGQLYGAIAQGIGDALYEQLVYDDDGQFLSGTLMDFLYPTTGEIPPIEIAHLTTPSPVTEGGVKGMAEGGTMATPAALCCAIADALSPFGVTISHTPLGPDDILSLLREAQARQAN